MVRIVHALLVALACVTLCQDVLAAEEVREVRVTSRDELIRALRNARPGTVIRIAPGTYRGGLSASNLQGTKEHPIVVTALDKSDPPHIVGEAVCLHLRRPAYVQLRHLVLRDARVNGLNIDDGHDPERPAQLGVAVEGDLAVRAGPAVDLGVAFEAERVDADHEVGADEAR